MTQTCYSKYLFIAYLKGNSPATLINDLHNLQFITNQTITFSFSREKFIFQFSATKSMKLTQLKNEIETSSSLLKSRRASMMEALFYDTIVFLTARNSSLDHKFNDF